MLKIYHLTRSMHHLFAGNQTVLIDFQSKKIPGQPDGMTIDSDGFLWIACIKGSQVRHPVQEYILG